MPIQLQNIAQQGNNVHLFQRVNDKLVITQDKTYRACYYEPQDTGSYTGYDGTKLRKIEVDNPFNIKKYRSGDSFSSDISLTKQYLINKVDTIVKSNTKYLFLDIEVYAKEIPNVTTATQPISCVSIYNSYAKSTKTWWILDYKGTLLQQEKKLFDDVLTYITTEQPDLILSWNIAFDWTYMFYRYLKLYNKSGTLAEVLSPIKLSHSGSGDYPDAKYPCGISIMDYLAMFKKVFMREPSYTLDAISQKYINDKSWGTSNFGELTQDIKDKNVNDVVRMQKLEDKFKLIDYFDEIRILTKTEWEDLYHNSFIVENMLFQEAHRQNIILPNRPTQQYGDEDSEETFEGAAREALKTGALFDVGKFDLTSAYPTMMVEFCLDATNIVTDGSGLDINGIQFQQNPNALIPSMVRRIMILKDTRKAELAQMKKGTDEYTTAKIKYDAIKGVANSTFGVMGFSSFRLYDNRVASAITYLVRNLLEFSRNQVKVFGKEVIYWDTDSVFITGQDDISKQLNEGIQDWTKLLGKDSINLKYEYEGYFSKIFIIALCRYVGHLVSKKGTEVEIKGAEAKRASSTKYEGQFQLKLIDKMLAKETQESILTWIEKERNQLRLYPLEEVSFPCKISNKEYKISKKTGRAVYPIFMRAVDNTNAIKKLDVPVGELLWWAYVQPIMQSAKGTDVDVLAFTKEDKDVVRQHKVDWNRMIERNINTKAENIFKAQNWSVEQLQNEGQLSLF